MLAGTMSAAVMTAGGSPAVMLPMNRRPVGIGLIAAIVLAVYLAQSFGWRQGALFVVGFGAGIVLYHAAFGFTSAWRRAIRSGRSAGLRAQLLMLAVTALAFLPLIADGQLWGMELRGNVRPLSLSVAAGAFLFGIGMQLGGGCASGTLFTVGCGWWRPSRGACWASAFGPGSGLPNSVAMPSFPIQSPTPPARIDSTGDRWRQGK